MKIFVHFPFLFNCFGCFQHGGWGVGLSSVTARKSGWGGYFCVEPCFLCRTMFFCVEPCFLLSNHVKPKCYNNFYLGDIKGWLEWNITKKIKHILRCSTSMAWLIRHKYWQIRNNQNNSNLLLSGLVYYTCCRGCKVIIFYAMHLPFTWAIVPSCISATSEADTWLVGYVTDRRTYIYT